MTLGTTTGLAMGGRRLYTWRLTFYHVRGPLALGEDILTISHQTETTITGTDHTTPGTMAGIGRLEECMFWILYKTKHTEYYIYFSHELLDFEFNW